MHRLRAGPLDIHTLAACPPCIRPALYALATPRRSPAAPRRTPTGTAPPAKVWPTMFLFLTSNNLMEIARPGSTAAMLRRCTF